MAEVGEEPAASKPGPPAAASRAQDDAANNRSKKVKKRGGKGASMQQEISVGDQHVDMVRLVRSERRTDNVEDNMHVQLSKAGKASQLQLSEDKLGVTGHKGFRSVRATHGVYTGAWYCEFTLQHLGSTGHARLGWCTKKAELQAPIGFDEHGFSYRDLEGSKVHHGRREPYGQPFKEGDVVGMVIHMPEGGRPIEARERKVVRFKGMLYYEDEPEPKPKPLPGSSISFSVNGVSQGLAFTDILEGTYYPAASIFTLPEQSEGATVVANFGPSFAFTPPALEGVPPAQPMSSLAAPPNAAATVAAADGVQQGLAGEPAAALPQGASQPLLAPAAAAQPGAV